jgi:hypothetical protein
MQPRSKYLFVLFLTLMLLSISAVAQAADGSQVLLSAQQTVLKAGQQTTVDILIKNAPAIYGADVQVAFDPKILEVVDFDAKQPGIQVAPGTFIDAQKAFFLANQADNKKGAIQYALTLLNPAPAVQGDGQLAQITFRAKANGSTSVSIEKGEFGTQTGETISPDLTGIKILVSDKPQPTPTPTKAAGGGQMDNTFFLVLLGSVALVIVALAGLWFWLRKTRHVSTKDRGEQT